MASRGTITRAEIERLLLEVEVYLEAVDVFRAEDVEPSWAVEEVSGETPALSR
jgi:hypothetical protein